MHFFAKSREFFQFSKEGKGSLLVPPPDSCASDILLKKHLKNCEKCFLFYRNGCFHSRDVQVFLLPSTPSFPLCWPLLNLQKLIEDKSWSLWCHHLSKLEFKTLTVKETSSTWRFDIETWSIDSIAENVHKKIVPDQYLILVNS